MKRLALTLAAVAASLAAAMPSSAALGTPRLVAWSPRPNVLVATWTGLPASDWVVLLQNGHDTVWPNTGRLTIDFGPVANPPFVDQVRVCSTGGARLYCTNMVTVIVP